MRFVARVRRREAPSIELRLGSGGTGGKYFMLILDPESTCKWYCNIKSNSYSGCKNEQQADFEVQLENIITITRHYAVSCSQTSKTSAENFQDFMLILDPESTCKWYCNKSQTVNHGVKMDSRLILRNN